VEATPIQAMWLEGDTYLRAVDRRACASVLALTLTTFVPREFNNVLDVWYSPGCEYTQSAPPLEHRGTAQPREMCSLMWNYTQTRGLGKMGYCFNHRQTDRQTDTDTHTHTHTQTHPARTRRRTQITGRSEQFIALVVARFTADA